MDLMQNLSIQNMIRGVLDEAKEKIAMDEAMHKQIEKKEQKALNSVSEGVGKLKKIEKEEAEKCASINSDIEKLAGALDYISENFESLMPRGVLSKALEKAAFEVTEGPGSLKVTQTRGGTMNLRHPGPVTPDAAQSTAHTGLDSHMGGAPNQIDNTHDHKPGDHSFDNHSKMPLQNPPKHVKTAAQKRQELAKLAKNMVLAKLAGEDVAKANIKAGKGPHAVGKGPSSVRTYDVSTSLSAPSSGGGHLRELIANNKAAFDFNKRQALRGSVKEQSGQVWDEPAFRDPTLHDTFVHNEAAKTDAGSTKTATQLLAKIASQGCVCHSGGGCPYHEMTHRLRKLAGMEALQPAGAAAADPAAAAGAPAADPAMMGQAPGRPEGCMCNGMPPLCKMCKLQLMIENMKAQQGGGMPPAGPLGAAPPAGPPGAGAMPPQQMGGA